MSIREGRFCDVSDHADRVCPWSAVGTCTLCKRDYCAELHGTKDSPLRLSLHDSVHLVSVTDGPDMCRPCFDQCKDLGNGRLSEVVHALCTPFIDLLAAKLAEQTLKTP